MSLFGSVAQLISEGESLVLAVIVHRSGSAPRSVGSRMVVRSDGSILGTIGGGILEAKVQNLSSSVFKSRETLVRSFSLSSDDAAGLGMICGGGVQVLIHYVDASDPVQRDLYLQTAAMIEHHLAAWLITRLPKEERSSAPPEVCLLGSDQSLHSGTLDRATALEMGSLLDGRHPGLIRFGQDHFLAEPLSGEGSVYLFGAGHISRELALLTKLTGFRTTILDDRPEFADRERFPTADDIRVLDSFDLALSGLHIDRSSYLVILTRGHAHDRTVLRQALRTGAGYIGMIGSRGKRDAIYESLLNEGFSQNDLDRVHSPVGLAIGAETPEEIALSIAAQLVQIRAGKGR